MKQLKLFVKEQKVNLVSIALAIALYMIIQLNVEVKQGIPYANLLAISVKLSWMYVLYVVSHFYVSRRIKA